MEHDRPQQPAEPESVQAPPRVELSHSSTSTSTARPVRPSSPGTYAWTANPQHFSGSPESLSVNPPLPPSQRQSTSGHASFSQEESERREYEQRTSHIGRSSPPLPPVPGPTYAPTLTHRPSAPLRRDTASPLGVLHPSPYGVGTAGPSQGQRVSTMDAPRRPRSMDRGMSVARQSEIDWVVPTVPNAEREEKKTYREKTVGERLDPTLITAIAEKDKYAFKAKLTGWALNAAIGLQVVLGAMTTGLSVVTTGKQTQIMTTILGGLATIVASYLARARGSNEPELSITRVKDLEQFIRECEAFRMDYGHKLGVAHDSQLDRFRERFEELLGNANGERKLSTPV